MSRGHGALQRKILELLEKYPDGAPALAPGLEKYGPSEWTTSEFWHHIYVMKDETGWSEDHAYSLKATIRRALSTLRDEGLISRRPSSSSCRHAGSVPWVWALTARDSLRGAQEGARRGTGPPGDRGHLRVST